MQVYFPSCWDGVNLDSSDHKSHVAYPNQTYDNGPCPASHPVRLMSIFYEVTWNTGLFSNMWYGSGQPFVLAQGDPTGYGLHGDFVSLSPSSVIITGSYRTVTNLIIDKWLGCKCFTGSNKHLQRCRWRCHAVCPVDTLPRQHSGRLHA
jgi:hypothetical protein